jgi:hypothetical protein
LLHAKPYAVVLALFTLMFIGVEKGRAANINVQIFSGFNDPGGPGAGQPFSGFVGSFTSPDIQFGTNTGFNWHPFGQSTFGATMTDDLLVASTGVYTFFMPSDDGSTLFIDGVLVLDNGGDHGQPGPNPTLTIPLTAGFHSFEITFFEQFAGTQSGIDFNLPDGVQFADPPPSPSPPPGRFSVAPWRRLPDTAGGNGGSWWHPPRGWSPDQSMRLLYQRT